MPRTRRGRTRARAAFGRPARPRRRAARRARRRAPGAVLLTVEADPERAERTAQLFEGEPGVRVAHGDWHEVLPAHAPFDLVFFDGGRWKERDSEDESRRLLELVAPGGVVLID